MIKFELPTLLPKSQVFPEVHVGRSKYCGVSKDACVFLRFDNDVTRLHGSVAMEIVEEMLRIHFVFYLCYTRRTENGRSIV